MRFLWLNTVKDLRRYRRGVASLVLWFVLPLVIAALIGVVFGRGDVSPHGLLLVADEDRGVAGTFLRESISRGPLGTMLAIQQVDRAEGRRRIDAGDASALLIIPAGYDRAVMRNDPAEWTLVTNPELSLMPHVIHEVASANVDAAFYLQHMAGPQLRAFQDAPVSSRSFAALAAGIARSVDGVSTYLNPPRIALKTTAIGDPSAHRSSVAEMLFPGIVLLVILMVSAGMAVEIWKEPGAVRRASAASASLVGFLAGKVAATTAVLLVTLLLTFAAGAIFGVPMRAGAVALIWSAFCATAVYCGMLAAQLWLGSERTAMTIAAMLMVPLAMLGGAFVPLEMMPDNLVTLAGVIPNSWMLVRLQAMLAGPVPVGDLVRDFSTVLAGTAVLFALARWQLKRRFVR